MNDPYAAIAETDPDIVRTIAERLEVRAADPQQRQMRDAYLSRINFPEGATVVEIGCGTGPVTRTISGLKNVGSITGIDPSPILIESALRLSAGHTNISFEVGDARAMPFADGAFDVAIFHTALCHILEPERALAEAFRVLKAGGTVCVFDGDYATATVATAEIDPLQACSAAVTRHNVMDRWLVRRLPQLLQAAGFSDVTSVSHGYFDNDDPGYMLGHAMRGAEVLRDDGVIGPDLCEALQNEAKRRATSGTFFGHIAYASFIGAKSR
jgi:ubiquinone/menaquinone biosynthesis C-methylase UbiE